MRFINKIFRKHNKITILKEDNKDNETKLSSTKQNFSNSKNNGTSNINTVD